MKVLPATGSAFRLPPSSSDAHGIIAPCSHTVPNTIVQINKANFQQPRHHSLLIQFNSPRVMAAVSAVSDGKLCTAVARLVRACRPGDLSALRIRHQLEERWACDLIPRIDFIRECIQATLSSLPPPPPPLSPPPPHAPPLSKQMATKRKRDDEFAMKEAPLPAAAPKASKKKLCSACTVCGFWVLNSSMKKHLSKHERPHKCDFCDYRTSQKSNLTRHIGRKHS